MPIAQSDSESLDSSANLAALVSESPATASGSTLSITFTLSTRKRVERVELVERVSRATSVNVETGVERLRCDDRVASIPAEPGNRQQSLGPLPPWPRAALV